ncbi:glucosamine-6-phosphate deaminase [Maribacter sp. ANRC-HE7]|uniref:Glucosamine-6-phosphate deaminase n=1 Tax=Maribacter aquimaris TaxID=2737171 RepID=A0ABR7UZ33_9FLAO|nr:glucosamine-6-phosphate deaminase [Maribacter aquimaris]MBD0777551.1 glucosamine-6-phosphate deaminase [Maribacter aquimaris]
MNTTFKVQDLNIDIYQRPEEMGKAAADFVEMKINEAIAKKGIARVILATGSSQFTFLKALRLAKIDWKKVIVFHLDEYYGIADTHPASFRKYLKERILDFVNPLEVYLINGDAEDIEDEMDKYAARLREHEIDVACIGIGENGHIAFNDPPVADFNDTKLVKLVDLDEQCRNQQLGEGWFPTIDDVPKKALTLTIPAIMNSKAISCVVPDERKAEAVYNALNGDVTTDCPASVLRRHNDIRMFLDVESASRLQNSLS